jgi:hypothetical protein
METLKLRCGEYGTGCVFSIEMKCSAEVGELQEAIYYQEQYDRQYDFAPSELTLYLARKKHGDSSWLKHDHGTEKHLQGDVDTEYEKMLSSWKLNNPALLGPDFQLREAEIHVLVQLPDAPRRPFLDPRIKELHELLLRHVLLGAETQSLTYTQTLGALCFKPELCIVYDCNASADDKALRCMLLDTALPCELVVACHLFRRRTAFLAEKLMGISDIDDVRNGLLLFAPLKQAFKQFQISFVYDPKSDAFRLTIFDPHVAHQQLVDRLDDAQRGILLQSHAVPTDWKDQGSMILPGTEYDLQTTFSDLEGRALCFRSLARPFKRCLSLQARLARINALEKYWIESDEEEDFPDFVSEGMSVAEKMELFFQRSEA